MGRGVLWSHVACACRASLGRPRAERDRAGGISDGQGKSAIVVDRADASRLRRCYFACALNRFFCVVRRNVLAPQCAKMGFTPPAQARRGAGAGPRGCPAKNTMFLGFESGPRGEGEREAPRARHPGGPPAAEASGAEIGEAGPA